MKRLILMLMLSPIFINAKRNELENVENREQENFHQAVAQQQQMERERLDDQLMENRAENRFQNLLGRRGGQARRGGRHGQLHPRRLNFNNNNDNAEPLFELIEFVRGVIEGNAPAAPDEPIAHIPALPQR